MTSPVSDQGGNAEVERVFRDIYGQVVATLVRIFGDITLAEDAAQDAFVVATKRWPVEGVPPNPGGWIVTTARNRGIDVARRSARGRELLEQIGAPDNEPSSEEESPVKDDQLRLMFTCCHPSLAPEHRVALTLRLLGGLSVEEAARSFLVSEAAMAKRLVRAKYKIKAANIPYRIPRDADLPARVRSVLAVLYLIYNTGADDPNRSDLMSEAIRLCRALVDLMPDEPEAAGLLALMLLDSSRAAARRVNGEVIVLRDQDRGLWDQQKIGEGHAIVRSCLRRNRPGPYQLQAAIQAVHCSAASFGDTDWVQIVDIYDHLLAFLPTPVVALNRAIAVGESQGPEAGLEALDEVAPDLDNYYLMHAARAKTLKELGLSEAAREAYRLAADRAVLDSDRRFLVEQLEEVPDV